MKTSSSLPDAIKTERWQVQYEKMKPKIYERLKRRSKESNKIREGWKAEGDDVKKEERVPGGGR